MTESLIIIILSIFLVLPIILKILGRKNLPLSISVSYLLGLSIWTYLLFILNTKGITFSLKNVLVVYSFLLALFFFAVRFFKSKSYNSVRRVGNNKNYKNVFMDNKILLIVISLLLIFTFIANLYWPVKDWDSLVLYDFRAKLFAEHGGMKEAIEQGYFTSYPLMTSLSHMLVYLFNVSASPMLLYEGFYLSILIIFYYSLKILRTSTRVTLFFTLALMGYGIIFEQSTVSYTNLPYTAYLFTGYIFLLLWLKNGKVTSIFLSALFTGLSGWVRFAEPFWIVIVIVASLLFWLKKKRFYISVYILSVYLLRLPWSLFVESVSGPVPYAAKSISKTLPFLTQGARLENIKNVLSYLYVNVILEYGIVILFYVVLFYFVFMNLKKRLDLTFISDLLVVSGIIGTICLGTFLFSILVESWFQIGDSLRRMSMIIVPFAIFASARLFDHVYKER